MKLKKLALLVAPLMLLASCGASNNCPAVPAESEIALGSSVLGNWSYRNAQGENKTKSGAEVQCYVDAETKFHFTVTKYYTDFAPSLFTFEGQITAVEKGVGSCFAVFMNGYLNHGVSNEATTEAAKTQFKAYRDTIPDMYDGEGQFQITFHRLTASTGYITTDNADFDLAMGIFEAVDALGVSSAQ